MRFAIALLAAISFVNVTAAEDRPTADRIHELLFARVDGNGLTYPHMVDPPIWGDSRHLLEDPAHRSLLKLLDEVVSERPDDSPSGVRRRALLQHELWRLFDWIHGHNLGDTSVGKVLRKSLAETIRHVALSKTQIDALSSNLPTVDTADAPPNVLDESRGWVSLGLPTTEAIAPAHLMRFEGRSTFGVFLHHPAGVPAATKLLKQLADVPFPLPAAHAGSSMFVYDAARPDLPIGAKVGLLRRMMLIDREGELVCSPIVQSLQLRTFLKIESNTRPEHVRMEEFTLVRAAYIAGEKPALRMVGAEDREPKIFMSHNYDIFEHDVAKGPSGFQPLVLESCFNCHRNPGVLSMNSFTGHISRIRNPGPRLEPSTLPNPRLEPRLFACEVEFTIAWKREQPSWRGLRSDDVLPSPK